MPLSDLPISILFLFFLSLFILIGIYPAWKRSAAKFRKLLAVQTRAAEPLTESFSSAPAETGKEQPSSLQLEDFETLVLWRLIQNSKPLSRKKINNALHLEPEILKQALDSLAKKNLVHVAITSFFGIRFYLSETGHAYAVKQGYIPQVQRQNEPPSA